MHADALRAVSLPTVSLALALALAALAQTAAGLSRLGLYGDGAYCLRQVLTSRWFGCIEAPRRAIQMALEAPTLLCLRLGLTDLHALSVIFSLTLQAAPLLLTCLAIAVLWPAHRPLCMLPALHYAAGASAIASAGMIEGPTAAAYAWVLLALILARSETPWQRALLALAALPAPWGHEVMLLLAPVLAAAAVRAATALSRATRDRGERRFMLALAMWFAAVACLQLWFTLAPRDSANRQGFVEQLLGLRWLWAPGSGLGVPAVAGLLGLAAVATVLVLPRIAGRLVPAVLAAVLGLAVLALVEPFLRAPILTFFARNQPAFVSIPLALTALLLRHHPQRQAPLRTPAMAAILLVLALTGSLVQAATTRDWAYYLRHLEHILHTRTGIIAQEDLRATLPAPRRAVVARMAWGWTYPDLSLLLSGGQVDAIIANPGVPTWQPWTPALRATYPKTPLWRYGTAFPPE